MKTEIENKVNDFILGIAELYEPHLATSINNDKFEEMVEAVLDKKEILVKELLSLLDEKEPIPEVTPESPKPPQEEGVKDLWRGGTDLPREITNSGPVNENFSGEDFSKMASAAVQAINTPDMGSAGFVDEATDITPHNLGMSVAEEGRISQGLPPKRKAPHIHVDHTGAKENAPNIPRPVPKARSAVVSTPPSKNSVSEETKSILRRIQDICMPHQMSPDKTLSSLACSLLSLASVYLPTDHPEEAPRYESLKDLWAAMRNIIGTLKDVQSNLGKYRELGKLQKDINEVITTLIVETAQYSLPDEIPIEEATEVVEENPTKAEENNG